MIYRLVNIGEEPESEWAVRATLSFAGPWGELESNPIPGWNGRPIDPMTFSADGAGLEESTLEQAGGSSFVLEIDPMRDLLPGSEWSFRDLDDPIRSRATDYEHPYTFGHMFMEEVRVELVLHRNGNPVDCSDLMIEVCDGRGFGSLYRRVLEGVVQPDTARQAAEWGLEGLDSSYHPWFPVLLIGLDKADLYTRALVEDIVHKKRHLTDPRWLMRVGLYLELLTCLGIFEAVREELGDLLTEEERREWESSPWYQPIREAIDVEGWKAVWALRSMVRPQIGAPRAGNVSALNLLAKKKATLAFLKTHHEDLKHAIRMAGANDHNAQETWHRVFRDAERAVLRKMPDAFPELEAFPPKAREVILWHQRGKVGRVNLPSLSNWFGDQDGLYASACNQYRASMNHVGDWARREKLMDHTGPECVPEEVSLLKAFMKGKNVWLGQLQRRDGYAESIDVSAELPPEYDATREAIVEILRSVSLFEAFDQEELYRLAGEIRPIRLGPVERIIVQGREGSSLFILAEGQLEVLVRQEDGNDLPVATLESGAVFGEMSLLTGEKRSATVRSYGPAVVYEIGRRQLAPILQARPSAIDQLAEIMEPRIRATKSAVQKYEARGEIETLGRRIRSFFGASSSGQG